MRIMSSRKPVIDSSIGRQFFLNGIFIASFGLFSIVFIFILMMYLTYRNELKSTQKRFIENQEEIVRYEVKRAIKDIRFRLKNTSHTKNELKDLIVRSLSQVRFPNLGKERGILFIRSYDGILIMSVSRPDLVGKDVSKKADPDGIITHDVFMDLINTNGEGYASYSWYNMVSKKVQLKKSFVEGFPELNWYIGAGFWYDDINQIINMRKKELINQLILFLIITLLLSIVIFFVVYLMARRETNKLNTNFRLIIQFFEKVSNDDILININKLEYPEFQSLAKSANDMLIEKSLAKKALSDSESKFRSIFELSPDLINITNKEGYIVNCNQMLVSALGYKDKSEVIGLHFSKLFIASDEDNAKNKVWEASKNKEIVNEENYLKSKSGKEIPVLISGSVVKFNNPPESFLISVARDITEIKKIESENNKSRNSLLRAEEIASIGNWEFDIDKRILSASYGSYVIYGVSLFDEELSSDLVNFAPLLEYRKMMNKALLDLIAKDIPYIVEFKIKRRNDGSIRDIRSIAEFDKEQRVVFGVIRDITEEKSAECRLKEQNDEYSSLNEEYKIQNEELLKAKERAEESNSLKSTFLQNMSHEIRTPMNGILGFSQLLSNPELRAEKKDYYIKIIQSSSNQLMRIIDDILEISQLETKQVAPINEDVCLNDLLSEQFSIFEIEAKTKKLELRLKNGLSDIDSFVKTDETKFNKILSNLLENAFKFTESGYIEFGYRLKTLAGEHNELQIYVKDTGIGINMDKQEMIFERFSQEETELSQKYGGLGLGLSIAKENTELLGGKIWVESEQGKGTTFYFTIPCLKK